MKIIALCGDIGSGKDTVADRLVDDHGFLKLSFAHHLKKWVLSLVEPLGVERRHIFGDSDETKQADQAESLLMLPPRDHTMTDRKLVSIYWTGRSLLEHLGTDVARAIDPDVWVRHVVADVGRRMKTHRGFMPELRFVIPDARFPNEFDAVRQTLGGEVWRTRLKVLHGMDQRWEESFKGEKGFDKPCPAADDWRDSCHCGAIRSTGHESDEVWRHLDFDRMLHAKKPGVERLLKQATEMFKEMAA